VEVVHDFAVRVSDGDLSVTTAVRVTVNEVNRAPVLTLPSLPDVQWGDRLGLLETGAGRHRRRGGLHRSGRFLRLQRRPRSHRGTTGAHSRNRTATTTTVVRGPSSGTTATAARAPSTRAVLKPRSMAVNTRPR